MSAAKSGIDAAPAFRCAYVYNRATYAAEKRAALDLWANHLRVIVAQASGANVQRLKRA
jgi:hypothetical protein